MTSSLRMPGSQPFPSMWSPRLSSPKFFMASTLGSGLNTRGLLVKAHPESSTSTTADSLKAVLSAAAAVNTSIKLARTLADNYIPREYQEYLLSEARGYFSSEVQKLFSRSSSEAMIVIEESNSNGLESNQMFKDVQVYLDTKISPSTRRVKVLKPKEEENLSVSMDPEEEVIDFFNGVKVKWSYGTSYHRGWYSESIESGFYELSFQQKHRHMMINSYLPHIVEVAKSLREETKKLKLFTWSRNRWCPVNLAHPATFETLAMDSEIKQTLLEDLERFVKRKDYYRRVGKAWKRGYLLYGPPGTGKSSFVAAMANYLKFDIYDLELTKVQDNMDLRTLLGKMANKSILVVEDIDRTINFNDSYRANSSKVTLSGLLNFIDGLWSSSGDERIIVFTTNHKEKLDPALLRPGRMDVHVHMSYCTLCGFKVLAAIYLGVKDHALFGEMEDLIRTAEVTPAEVADQLLKGSEEPDDAFIDMIDFLEMKKKEMEERKSKDKEEEELMAKKQNRGKKRKEKGKVRKDGD